MASIDTQALHSICILRLSAIGDVCHTLPVVRTLQAALPGVKLTWIIGKLEHQLVGDIPDIEFLVFDKQSGKVGMRALVAQLRERRFDLLLDMQVALRASRIARQVRAPLKLGFDRARARDGQWLFTNRRIPARSGQHVMDGLFGFAEALGINQRELRWDIPLTAGQRDFAREQLPDGRPGLVLSPCSSQRSRNFRNWPVERYVMLLRHAIEHHGCNVVITGGPTALERDYAVHICAGVQLPVTNLVGQTSLKQLLALIERAAVVVAPDSGPIHMAGAMGTPVVGLYASSNPRRTGPLDARWTIDRYADALQQFMGRRPEQVRWGQRVRHPEVMQIISTQEVCAALDALLAQTSVPG